MIEFGYISPFIKFALYEKYINDPNQNVIKYFIS